VICKCHSILDKGLEHLHLGRTVATYSNVSDQGSHLQNHVFIGYRLL
jgi:hypothetical protein